MRVLHVTRGFPPREEGGISTAVGGLVNALRAQGAECSVVSFDAWRPRGGSRGQREAKQSWQEGVDVIRLEAPSQLEDAYRKAWRLQPQAIHLHHEVLLPFARRFEEVRCIYTAHVLQSEQNRLRGVASTASGEAQVACFAAAQEVLVPSALAAELAAKAGTCARVVGFGVADSPAAQVARERARDQGAPHLVFAGRFADIKGLGELLEVLPFLLDDFPKLRVSIAGGLPENRRAERGWHKKWAERSNAAHRKRVRFLGWLGRGSLQALFADATVVAVPSWLETYGQVALEALLCGAPVVATPTGALNDAPEECFLACGARDPQSLREALAASLSAPQDRERRRTLAASWVLANHRWDQSALGHLAVYRSCCR